MKLRSVILLMFALLLAPMAQAQSESGDVKKIAILEIVNAEDNIKIGKKVLFRVGFEIAVSSTPGYKGYFVGDISEVLDIQKFQRTGNVSEEQIKEIGRMTGADYLLIAQIEYVDDAERDIVMTARLVDVETALIVKSAYETTGTETAQINQSCIEVVGKLLLRRKGSGHSGGNISNNNSYSGSGIKGSNSASSGESYIENILGLNMKMVYVPGGTFTMGATSEQSGAHSDETPTHQVTLDGYYIGATEVTQAQWQAVMGSTIYQQRDKADKSWPMRGVGGNYPMYYVSYEEAMAFCAELSHLTGRTYMLPTEAQWEYAARGGNAMANQTQYSGSTIIDVVAWYDGNSGNSTHPVATKRGNNLGLYDMSGNVWEWCYDWYGSYSSSSQFNPAGPSSGSNRVLRGGSWYIDATYCRVSYRICISPSIRRHGSGFRVVCIP